MYSFAIVTLGCPKNQVDSEIMKGLFMEKGFWDAKTPEKADIIVVNTCGFILDAKEESINTLLRMVQYKEKGSCSFLIATGCLTQRYGQELAAEIPEIDAMLGTTSFPSIIDTIEHLLKGKKVFDIRHRDIIIPEGLPRSIPKGAHYSYIRIAEGCNNRCSYCIIPKLRGKYRSRRKEDIIKEAEHLSSAGVKEAVLIAQDTAGYGRDLYKELKLPKLLRKLCDIKGLSWIRLLYCYPDGITDGLLETIKEHQSLCKYLDIPIQHASDKILRAMNRRTSAIQIERLLNRIREQIPEIAIRSTIITGFPGEDKGDFEKVVDFVRKEYFDRLGVFTYSREENTPSYNMKGGVPEHLAVKRKEVLMLKQRDISLKNNASLIGHEETVIVDCCIDNQYYGRTYRDAPEIDNIVLFTSQRPLNAGDFVNVKIEHAFEYELVGRVVQ